VFEDKTVAVIVPCYNEEAQVGKVLRTMPDFVDCVLVIDDKSTDGTVEVVRGHIAAEGDSPRTVLLEQDRNQGQGAAVVRGYREVLARGFDVAAVMDGDGQMDPDELRLLVGPVARGQTDYAKGNRLFYRGAWETIPHYRYLGNAFLSMLTKIASGYWHVADSQTAYVAVSRKALGLIDLDRIYPRFGYPNDMLVRLNVCNMRVADVPIRPVYNVGEQSSMRVRRVLPTMMWLIFKRFCWRMVHKYVIHDFHPLVMFYSTGAFMILTSVVLFIRMIAVWIISDDIPDMNALLWVFCLVSAAQLILFAMWFDMEMNRDLKATVSAEPGSGSVDERPQTD
jgi:glycosyltransferase involved in cell wall biosynthesis